MPPALKQDQHAAKRVRMFLISHLFGPLLGHPISVFLYFIDPTEGTHLWVLAASITIFWAFPFALKLLGRHYSLLALVSVQNLVFAILWGAYHYGGVSSPFLMWLLVVPLLAFFYLGSTWFTRLAVPALIGVNLLGFYVWHLAGHAFPVRVPLAEMVGIGIVSTLCAAMYVCMMAIYYANIVDSQSELLKEIERHRATMKQLVEAKNDAEAANRAKSEFLAKMSHELRTPLNVVLGYSEILVEDAELEGRGDEVADLQKINGAGKHLLSMVNDVLDLSKIEAGKMELVTESIDLEKFVNELAATCRPMITSNTNELTVSYRPGLGSMIGDPTKLRQIALNLLSNAAKFTENGKIALEVAREAGPGGDWIEISVADTGIGISAEDQQKLFRNFSQVHAAMADRYGGTGLGLALSRKLCRLMGGDIAVTSELGRGSRFSIRVPASCKAVGEVGLESQEARAAYVMAAIDPQSALSPDGRSRIALVIDDEHSELELAERILVKEGFQAVLADNAETGLRLARTLRPALILLDVLLPGSSGWEVLKALKADPNVRNCPVVILSVIDDRRTAAELGAAEHLVKPLYRESLQKVLERLEGDRTLERAPALEARG